jgi:fatty acid-binding protein DegV
MPEFNAMFNQEINELGPGKVPNQSGASTTNDAQTLKLASLAEFQALQTQQIKSNGQLNTGEARQLTTLLSGQKLPEFNNAMVNMLLNLNNSILDAVVQELLGVVGRELGGGDVGIDISFLNQLMQRLDKVVKDSPNREIYSKALQQLLSQSVRTDPAIKQTIQTILKGINQLDATQPLSMDTPINTREMAPTSVPNSVNTSILGASNMMQIPGLDGLDDLIFEKDTVQTKDKSIRIEKTPQNGVTADIELHKDDRIVGHAKAFGTLNQSQTKRHTNPFISAVIQIANIQPLFIISSVAVQLMVQMGRLSNAHQNTYQLAIVTDNVAALREIDPVDYIRKVNVGDQSQYAIYETYKSLYEDGYHYIISLHLNPNLKKTYRSAIEAKQQIDRQNIEDLEINVFNTNANGVGLGLMIYELVDAIQNNFSPLEVNQLTHQLVKNYRHWVCPLEFDFVKNHQWAMDLADTQKKVQMRLFHFIPVIELDRTLTIVSVSHTKEAAFISLMAAVNDIIESKSQKINRICIEYRGVFREAIKIRNQIKSKCPTTKVSLKSVGSLTTNFFGPELVGICVI